MKKIISLFQRNYDGDRLVRDEVAALRAPTIAAVTDEQVKAGAAAAVEWLRGFEYLRIQLTQSDRSFGTGLTRAILQAALATPSPTIAAPSPSQANTLDLPPRPVCGETLVTRYSGPLPGCPQGISTAVCPTDPSHVSQPTQASPSKEGGE